MNYVHVLLYPYWPPGEYYVDNVRLSEYSLVVHRFFCNRYYVRIGDSILHGDVADRIMDQQGLTDKREQWDAYEPRGVPANMLYDIAIATRLHRLAAAVVHRDRAVAKRIIAYLNDIDQGTHNGLRQVYFGHTHKAVSGFEYEGLIFHNGGAPIRGISFRIVPL